MKIGRLWIVSGPGAVAGALLLVGVYCGVLRLTGNFHEVIPGELYRSAQLSEAQIASYGNRYGIRTIVNLRGRNKGRGWYDGEVAAVRALGIDHVDFGMSAQRQLSPERAAELVAILKTAEKPILIHCKGGADRTGLAASLYLAFIANKGENAAEAQLSIRYGHFSIPVLSQAFAMDETFEMLEPRLGFPDS